MRGDVGGLGLCAVDVALVSGLDARFEARVDRLPRPGHVSLEQRDDRVAVLDVRQRPLVVHNSRRLFNGLGEVSNGDPLPLRRQPGRHLQRAQVARDRSFDRRHAGRLDRDRPAGGAAHAAVAAGVR